MSRISAENFESICRLCTSTLESGGRLILEDGDFSYQQLGLADQILDCLKIKVYKEDLLPKSICIKCLELLTQLHTFRSKCQQIQENLLACVGFNAAEQREEGEKHSLLATDQKNNNSIKIEESSFVTTETEDPSDLHSSDNDDTESQVNGIDTLPELGEPCPEDYVLMKEDTFVIEASRVSRANRNKTGILADHLIEFNNNSEVRDRDVVDTQKLRQEVLPAMWDVYEKTLPNESGELQVTHRRYIVSKIAFPCSLCGACYKFDQGCARGETPESRPYECAVCHKVFPRRSLWKRHLATHEDAKPFLCRECGKGFNRKEHLSRHLLCHSSIKPYNCEGCGKFFNRKEHLTRHHMSNPACLDPNVDPLRPYCCPTCGQGFVRKEHLLKHCKRAHDVDPDPNDGEPKPFSCLICHKTFTRREHLRRHQAIHEREAKETNVNQEPMDDVSPPASPVETKLPPTPVKCEICLKVFTRRSHLLRHMKRIHGKSLSGQTHKCEDCNKEFGRRYHLDRHRRTHTVAPEYECVTCSEKFDQSELLDKHMSTAHGNTAIDNYLWM